MRVCVRGLLAKHQSIHNELEIGRYRTKGSLYLSIPWYSIRHLTWTQVQMKPNLMAKRCFSITQVVSGDVAVIIQRSYCEKKNVPNVVIICGVKFSRGNPAKH